MKIKPLGERVLLKRIEEDEQVRGGIIIPDSAKEKSPRKLNLHTFSFHHALPYFTLSK